MHTIYLWDELYWTLPQFHEDTVVKKHQGFSDYSSISLGFFVFLYPDI